MPVGNGGVGSFNIGNDCTIVVNGPNGQVQIDNIMNFKYAQRTADIKKKNMNGTTLDAALPDGWTGSFEVQRNNPNLDAMTGNIESGFIASGAYNFGSIDQYVTEIGGGESSYKYTNVTLKMADGGTWAGDDTVTMRFDFTASQRLVLS